VKVAYNSYYYNIIYTRAYFWLLLSLDVYMKMLIIIDSFHLFMYNLLTISSFI